MNDQFVADDPSGRSIVPVTPHSALPAPYVEPAVQPGAQPRTIDDYLNAIYRWRWLFLAVFVATVLTAAAWASLQTPLYRATATLELNPAPSRIVKPEGSSVDETPPPEDSDFLALQIKLIKSRSVAERVARSLALGRNAAFLRREPTSQDSAEGAVGALMGGLSAAGTDSDRIMQVSYVHPDPTIAAKVANGFADQAIEFNFDRSLSATARSRDFLQRRLEATRQDLEKSERALIDYARQAKIINVVSSDSPTSGDSAGGTLVASNLVALNQQLADAQNSRIVAQQKYAQASAAAQSAEASDTTVQSLQQQRAQLQAEYDQKLQTFQPNFPEMQALRARIAGLDSQIGASGSRTSSAVVNSLRADFVAAQNREHALQARINQLQSQFLDLNDRGVKYTILKRAVDANRSMYNALLEQLGAENSSATRTSSIAVVDTADVPGGPFSPNIPRTIMLALIVGLLLGLGAVLGADRFYDRINTPEDLKSVGLALIGVVPVAPKSATLDDVISDPQSMVAEAYHSARTALQFASSGAPPKSILFTSARPNEGKTSSVIAIAADFMSIGKSVVVIDADLRKPSLRGDSPGLSGVLAGACTLNDAILPVSGDPRLSLLPAGRIPPNPTALLTGHALTNLVRSLERRFDVVVIDGPPVLGFADAPLLSAVADGTVMIVAARSTSRSMARNAIARLQATGGEVIGGILNKFDRRAGGVGYGNSEYGYAYKYGGKTPQRSLIAPAARSSGDATE